MMRLRVWVDTGVEVVDTGCGSDGLGRLHFKGPHNLVPCVGLVPGEVYR